MKYITFLFAAGMGRVGVFLVKSFTIPHGIRIFFHGRGSKGSSFVLGRRGRSGEGVLTLTR